MCRIKSIAKCITCLFTLSPTPESCLGSAIDAADMIWLAVLTFTVVAATPEVGKSVVDNGSGVVGGSVIWKERIARVYFRLRVGRSIYDSSREGGYGTTEEN